jgi:hypothetical protein
MLSLLMTKSTLKSLNSLDNFNLKAHTKKDSDKLLTDERSLVNFIKKVSVD